jgi:hypothetical protein
MGNFACLNAGTCGKRKAYHDVISKALGGMPVIVSVASRIVPNGTFIGKG